MGLDLQFPPSGSHFERAAQSILNIWVTRSATEIASDGQIIFGVLLVTAAGGRMQRCGGGRRRLGAWPRGDGKIPISCL